MTLTEGDKIVDPKDLERTDMNQIMSVDRNTTLNMNSKIINNSIIEFCESMDLRTIRELSLCSNQLTKIPVIFSQHVNNLEELDLSMNNLEDLPNSFNLFSKLKHLILDHNKFQSLPRVLGEIRSLKLMSVSHNELEKIPEELGSLINLHSLDLSLNKLSELPHTFVRLNRLKELYLPGNKFKIIPECITDGIRNLEVLDLSLNYGIMLNVPPCSKKLRKFYAKENRICQTFPKWLLTSQFSNLEEVNLNETEFVLFHFPEGGTVSNVRKLSITQSTLSDNIINNLTKNMIMLEEVDIGNCDTRRLGNIFCSLPLQQLKNPQSVRKIHVPRSGIPIIFPTIGNFQNITLINLSGNHISWLPDDICFLQKLEILIIDNNTLTNLPKDFGNLYQLREFLASHNHLSNLPCSMKNLRELRLLDLYNNEFDEIPWNIVNLENLQGLDIDFNFCSVDNLKIREVAYEILRTRIREKYSSFSSRIIGIKSSSEELEYSESPDTSNYSDHQEEDAEPIEESAYVNAEEENWDVSEDSTDEYEPSFVFLKRQPSSSWGFKFNFPEHFFCPADLHVKTIREDVREMRDDRRYYISQFDEGQFDDA